MPKKVYIEENNLMKIKRFMTGENTGHKSFIVDNKPPYENDEYEIGGEGGNNDFFHINSKKQLTESARADLDVIDSISFTVDEKYNFDEDEYSHWWDDYNTEEEYLKSCEYYDGEVYDTDVHHIEYFSGDRDDVEYYFADNLNIAEKIFNRDAVLRGNTYWITDIQDELVNEMNVDINNVDEVNKVAKKLSKPNGASLFVLVDGSTIGFHDHAQIQSVCDGMTISKFLELGNIRCGGGNVVTIQLIKEPTFYQRHTLKSMLEYADEAIVDFAEPNKYDNMYPEVVHSVSYRSPNPERVVNDMVYYFREGIKPFDESIERKSKKLNENTFEKWFSNSVLTDSDGKPIKMYHGTCENFDTFSKDFIGSSGSGCYEGYGFNFTPAWSRAVSYSSGGNVIEAYLRAINPLRSDEHKITIKQLVEIIRKIDEGLPITDTLVPNYESPRYGENWDENYYNRAVKVMAKNLIEFNYEYGDAGVYAGVCESGSADPKKVISVFEEMGYDSVIFFEDKGIKTVIVFEPNQIKRVDNKTFNIDSDVMSENVETEVEASEVNLDSFKKKETLAPRIWDGFNLNPKARLRLLDIADDFWEFTNINWVKRKEIHLTGSICNYNWSKFSDIDLHLVVDFSEIDERKDFVQEYFNSKKNEWNNEHSKLKIYGYPVELYVEDVDAETMSGGLYDLEDNSWIKKPSADGIKQIGLDKYEIKTKSAKLMTLIDDLQDEFKYTDDDAKLREIGKKAHRLLNRIKRMRKFGLSRGGESDSLNIVFKVLRRSGYMDSLWELSSELYDKLNSIGINESLIKEEFDLFAAAKKYFGTTNDLRECGFILPDGSMLDLSGRHTGAEESVISGRRTVYHRSVEKLENENTPYITLSRFIEAGAIRCDLRGAFINLIKRPTKEQIYVLSRFINRLNGCVQLEIGDDDISIDYVVYDGASCEKIINDILNFFDNKVKPSYLNECVKRVISLNEDIDVFALAKERFGITNDIRECGYILPDGSMLDFSGRHMVTGDTDTSYLKGRRGLDHRDIGDLNWDKNMNTRTNTNINMMDFIRKGAIRIHCSNTWSCISLILKPTKEQINPLLRLIQYSKGCVTVEIGDGDNSYEYAEWDEANPRRVINDVMRYFDGETINLVGNVTENKVISVYYNKYIGLNEEVVADGNASHNPFKERWKREREALKNYLANYGELMTSKENGKQYKVLYDASISSKIGINYCICIQWNPLTMEPGEVIYVRAFDKFTRRIFKPEFDTRGFDNIAGNDDDVQPY